MSHSSFEHIEIVKVTLDSTFNYDLLNDPLTIHSLKSNHFKLKDRKPLPDIEYLLINCDDREHCQYVNEAVFHGYWYRGSHQRWGYYNAFDSQLPPAEILHKVKGIVFPGSRFSVYEDLPWIKELMEFARLVRRDYPHVRMVGICFGH